MKKSVTALPFVSAFLLAISFTTYYAGWMVLVALLPLIHYLHIGLDRSRPNRKRLAVTIWLAGYSFFLSQLVWILFTKPELWSGINAPTAKVIQYFAWVMSALVLSLGWLAFGYLSTHRHDLIKKPFYLLITLMSAWAIGEVIRSYLFSVLWWSPEAQLGSHWNFGSLGLAASATPVGFASRLLGLYGLGAFVIAVNVAIYWLLRRHAKQSVITACVLTMVVLVGYVSHTGTSQTAQVGILQTTRQQDSFDYNLAQLTKSEQPLDFMALPEYIDFPDDLNPPIAATFYDSFNKESALLVYTHTKFNEDGTRNGETVYRDQYGRIISTQSKSFLIPGGEYLPQLVQAGMKVTGQDNSINDYRRNRQLYKAEQAEHTLAVGKVSAGVLACSGVQSPELYRRMSADGANILANLASLDAFADAPFFNNQTKQLARFHAMANNRSFVQAASTGSAYAIDPNGNFIVDSPPRTLAFHKTELPLSEGNTLYSLVGEVWLLPAIAWIGYIALIKKKLRL